MKSDNPIKRHKTPYFILTVFTLFVCWFFVGRHGMFASSVDWISQHSVLPDYFRQQFYQTKDIFPEFAAGIGGGQNIYHFSYYGLYNPIILFSYLLPFVKMSDYLMIACVIGLVASVLLFYHWLHSQHFSSEICLLVSMLFLLASPMLFHSYRQVMFVNYMPFLCLSLIGVDRYWEKGKCKIYTLGVFLMILTSFYFAVGGIAAVLLYGISRYKKTASKGAILGFFVPIGTAVLAGGVLLVPTAFALLERSGSMSKIHLSDLLVLDFSLSRFAYSGYGIGLTAGILTVLFIGITYRCKREQFLSVCCLAVILFPVFSWIFNGGLYVRDKALIPFLPLFCYLTAVFLEKQKRKEISFGVCFTCVLCTVFYCCISMFVHGQGIETKQFAFLFCEAGCSVIFFLLYKKFKYLFLLLFPSIFTLVLFGSFLNGSDETILDKNFYQTVTDMAWGDEISEILSQEDGYYRLEQNGSLEEKKANINRIWDMRQMISSLYSSVGNEAYQSFREEVFLTEQPFRNCLMQSSSENPFFQKFMGVKYFLERDKDSDGFIVTTQEQVAPVIYATDQVISNSEYQQLPFPYNQTALMQYAVIEDSIDSDKTEQPFRQIHSAINETESVLSESSEITKEEHGYHIQAAGETKAVLSILGEGQRQEERILFLQFDVKNHRKNHDIAVDIAGVRNKLSAQNHIYYNENTTFTYVIRLSERQTEVEVLFGEGDYSISNIRSFLGNASLLNDDTLYQSAFCPDWEQTKGNQISGTIDVKHTGYLITSIPYDKGFELFVDGKPIAAQQVNMAFLGASLEEGKHQIDIIYHAAGMQTGKLFSCIGLILWGMLWLVERKGTKSFFNPRRIIDIQSVHR